MSRTQIEPGMLSLFRLTNGLWLLLFGPNLIGAVLGWNPLTLWALWGTLVTVVMLLYLYSGWLPHRLGRWYLPVGLLMASLGAVMQQWLEIAWRIQRDVPVELLFDENMTLFVPLFVPMIIVTAQYNFRAMIGFLLGTVVLQVSFAFVLVPIGSPTMDAIWGDVIGRIIIFPIAGLTVVRVVSRQKKERKALVEKNIELTRYATTVERLAISYERNRLARELHDTLAHTLSAVSVQLEALNAQLDSDPVGAKQTLKKSRKLTRNGLQEARRALQALRASPLEDLSLALAIRQLGESVTERSGLNITIEVPTDLGELRPEAEQSIYRITEESLNNVVRHARAQNVNVSLVHERGELRLMIADDGAGFDPEMVVQNGHYGLVGMRERALLCNGQLDIDSKPGDGTTVRLTVEE